MGRVKDKIALVTGASQGIGAGIAKRFSEEGSKVIIADIKDDIGKKLAASLHADYYHLDVSSEQEFAGIYNTILDKYGYIDILVNNAGVTGLESNLGPQDPENITLDSWNYVHKVNLNSVFLGCKYGIKLMKERGGSIINMSSHSGLVGVPNCVAYASSKAAIRNHTKSVALYCAQQGYNIRCNSLHPGAILTPMWDAMLGEGADRDKAIGAIAADIPLKSMGSSLDVANAALYLASDESQYVTGIELAIDGGIGCK